MIVTWLGCASVKLECGGKTLWFDPFMSMNDEAENVTDEETFADAREILITHGHFDHLMSIPELNSTQEIKVHCTETPHETLLQCGIPEQKLDLIKVGDTVDYGSVKVKVYQGKHNKIDFKIALQTAVRCLTSLKRFVGFWEIAGVHKHFPEAQETVLFEVCGDDKRALVAGSLNIPEDVEVPAPGADVLLLPFNGVSNPAPMALRMVETYKPKSVVMSHFDNAFPPMSAPVNLQPFLVEMAARYPDIPVRVPGFGEEITVGKITASKESASEHVA
jgi:L-ascorbate metabolism protein UlaG (beta-lactamase superfamily)